MSVDLTLYPCSIFDNEAFSLSVLEFSSYPLVHDAVRSLNPQELPGVMLKCYSNSGWGKLTEDAYGKPIMYTSAAKIVAAMQPLGDMAPKAAVAYLAACKPEQLVALYWH